MFNWILKFIPDQYKWSVAIKKSTWTIAKTGVAIVAGTKVGQAISPENWKVVTEVSAMLLAGGLKLVHDWVKMKYGDKPWGKWL